MNTRAKIDIPTLLAQVPLFGSLGAEELARLTRGTRELTAARGEILFTRATSRAASIWSPRGKSSWH